MHTEVNKKLETDEFTQHHNELLDVNKSLLAENCVARWVWKSGNLSPTGYAVPWEFEMVNTCPENFIWEENKANIVIVAPGLYQVSFGFYSPKKPTV